jgi:hypothetical protein
MWKLILAFIIFAAAALYLINKKGGDIDLSGEKHGADTHAPAAEASGAASTPAADASAAK